ncbi:hypothetical protein [Streptomyces echinoruber]|uniref:Uncharacterized protein n=1 Tax=Streptomyces echinoruber TaxID=68898 RepID=A0A918V6D2_9ACTN|nr:hypothetical protein [Streptomyces echinoruber]GGZ72889.1 hypothetical protein GCM10010389_07830 [Streptomyces echinoruber]
MIEAFEAAALMLWLAFDALGSVVWWWGPPLLAVVAVGVWRSLRPTGAHRLPRRAPAAAGGDTDTMPLTVVSRPPAPPRGAGGETDG